MRQSSLVCLFLLWSVESAAPDNMELSEILGDDIKGQKELWDESVKTEEERPWVVANCVLVIDNYMAHPGEDFCTTEILDVTLDKTAIVPPPTPPRYLKVVQEGSQYQETLFTNASNEFPQ
jgi:hypothetical protein